MKDGGPAYPAEVYLGETEYDIESNLQIPIKTTHPGMTLRDYFAGQCLSNANANTPEKIAETCYMVADAMIKEREK